MVTDPSFESYEISNQLRDTIVSRFSDVIGTAKIPILDLAGNYDKISKLVLETIGPDLKTLGLALTFFYIENIPVPPEVEQAIDTRAKIGMLGDMNRYAQYQSATAIGDAAKNPCGAAGAGIGIGARGRHCAGTPDDDADNSYGRPSARTGGFLRRGERSANGAVRYE